MGPTMQMTSAWDRAALIEALKHQGIELLEPAAERLLETLTDWVRQSASLTGGVTAAVVIPLLAMGVPVLQEQIDKIDPTDGDGGPADADRAGGNA